MDMLYEFGTKAKQSDCFKLSGTQLDVGVLDSYDIESNSYNIESNSCNIEYNIVSFDYIDGLLNTHSDYNLYTQLNVNEIKKCDNKQKEIIDKYMKHMYESIQRKYKKNTFMCIYPQPQFYMNEDNAVVVSFRYNKFDCFITFESEVYENKVYYGYTVELSEEDYISASGVIDDNSYIDKIDMIIEALKLFV